MTFTPEQVAQLAAPLHKSNVKRNPKGFDYVEAWHAIAEANRIFGHDGWTRETVMLTETNRDLLDLKGSNGPYQQWRVGYIAKVKITAGGTVREGTGFGSGMSKPEALGDAIESAVKEAESDAMKRALMTFGNPFGLALYDKAKANVTNERPEATPYLPTLAERADKLEAAVKAAKPGEIDKAWRLGAAVTALMSVEMPDRLHDLTALYEARKAHSTALTPADVPEFA